MISSILILSAYAVICSPTLTFYVVKNGLKLTRYIFTV